MKRAFQRHHSQQRIKDRGTPASRLRRLLLEQLEVRHLLSAVSVWWEAPADATDSGATVPAEVPFMGPIQVGGTSVVVDSSTWLTTAAIATADTFLANQRATLGLADPSIELVRTKAECDSLGMHHIRYQQTYHDIPVLGGEIIVHLDSTSHVATVNGRVMAGITVDAMPLVTPAQAIEQAENQWTLEYGDTLIPTAQITSLLILAPGLLNNTSESVSYLVWEVQLKNYDAWVDQSYFVDAASA